MTFSGECNPNKYFHDASLSTDYLQKNVSIVLFVCLCDVVCCVPVKGQPLCSSTVCTFSPWILSHVGNFKFNWTTSEFIAKNLELDYIM